MVVTTTRRVSPALLEVLYPAAKTAEAVPGLIFAADLPQLERRARAIAARARGGPTEGVTELYPAWQFEELTVGGRRILGGLATAETVRQAVTADIAFLSVLTHSNGFDAMLGGDLVLCHASAARGRALTGAPCCRLTGDCYRLHLPVADVAASGRLVTADEVRARILFLCTCQGILSADEAIDPSWGFADGILGSGQVAAVVTSWTYLVPDLGTFRLLLGEIYRGRAVGQAVAAVNRLDNGMRLAVLGDPAVAIDPLGPEALDQLRFETVDAPVPGDGGRFLSALVYSAGVDTAGDQQQLAADAGERLRVFEHAVGLGLSTTGGSWIGAAMREAVLAFLGCCGNLVFLHWMPLTSRRRRFACPCEWCGSVADLFLFEFRQVGIPSRELVICPACGIRRDAAVGCQLRLARRERTLFLEGPLPATDWGAILHLGCQDRKRRTNIAWPADESGAPARTFAPPGPWPPGPLTLSVMLVAGTELTIVTTTGLGDPPGPPPP